MSESVLAGVSVDPSCGDGRPVAANDRKLHAAVGAIAVLGRFFPRCPGLHAPGDPRTGGGQSGGAGGEIRDKDPSRPDPHPIHGL